MKEHYDVVFRADGTVTRKDWVYDEEHKKGEYVTSVVTSPYKVLDKIVAIERGFTVRHLFEFVRGEAIGLDVVFNNCFIKDYVDHYKRIVDTYVEPSVEYDPDAIESIVVEWFAEVDDNYITDGIHVNGRGWILREDKIEDGRVVWPAGSAIPWALDFAELKSLLHLSIVLDEKYEILRDIRDNASLFVGMKKFTVGDIIRNVFWELSFYGTPEETTTQKTKLMGVVDEVEQAIASGDGSKFEEVEDVRNA